MKRLITSYISGSTQLPIKKGTLDFLQDQSEEVLVMLGKTLVGPDYSTSVPYALYGCVNTGSGSDYVISEGIILYNNDLYISPAATFTVVGINTAVCTITTQYVTGTESDPVEHTDGIQHDVHSDHKVIIASGITGSGSFNYSALKYCPVSSAMTMAANFTASSPAPSSTAGNFGLVLLHGEATAGASAADGDTIATISNSKHYPKADFKVYMPCYNSGGGGSMGVVAITVKTTGAIVLDQYITVGGSSLPSKKITLSTISYYNK